MARKITMNASSYKSVAEVFEDFVISQTAQGLSSVTLTNYRHHFHSISRHLDTSQSMDALTKSKLEAMVVSMRQSSLAHKKFPPLDSLVWFFILIIPPKSWKGFNE